jgi:acetyl esterase/lipase
MPNEISIQTDIGYAEDGRQLLWDIYRPLNVPERTPAILLLHGGAWRAGNRSAMANAATLLAKLGFAAIAPEYRLIGEVQWPTPLDDVKTAIRAVRAHAVSLNVDPAYLFLVGYSAGAHLAMLAASLQTERTGGRPHATQSETVSGVAAFFPPSRLGSEQSNFLKLSGDQIAMFSPITHAQRLPPIILLCGDADSIAPVANSIELHDAIRRGGGIADLRLYADLEHEFVSLPGMLEISCREVVEFFYRTSINHREFDAASKRLAQRWATFRSKS